MRKITRKGIIKKLDKRVTEITIEREPACVMCGSTEQLGNGHVFSRGHQILRWDVRPDGNCHTQCWAHNYGHVHNTYPYYHWYIEKFGQKRWDELYSEWERTSNFKVWELVELYKELENIK
jgi:hypothetical protein